MTVLADPYEAQRGTVSGAASVVAPGQRNQSAPELVRYLTSKGGRHKVLFGSNVPMISPQQGLAGLDALGLDDETRELFLDGNARRVFGL